jgi:hypothetical protein
MIYLEPSALVGKGLHRECYRHPHDNNLCIKVVVAGNDDETRREQKYYASLNKRNISWDMLPRYHGDVETNLGTGAVFDLALDHDGEVSKTLQAYLSSAEHSKSVSEALLGSLNALKNYLLQHHIITMTIKPKNIACQNLGQGDYNLMIIDNIGNSDYLPLCNLNHYLAKRKIQRKWARFEATYIQPWLNSESLL